MKPAPPVTRIRMGSAPPRGPDSETVSDESNCSQCRQEPCRTEGGWITNLALCSKSFYCNSLWIDCHDRETPPLPGGGHGWKSVERATRLHATGVLLPHPTSYAPT